jgi:hypothetical protein
MALILNDNIKVNAGKPVESKNLNGVVPYTTVAEVNASVPMGERHIGLTVNINNVEYWYRFGVTAADLVKKTSDTEVPSESFITGATNIGYFSGQTGVQALNLHFLYHPPYNGDALSLYNNYYRGADGIIRIGAASDNINKRGYVINGLQPQSFVWSESTVGSELLGWMLVDGDLNQLVGSYATPTFPLYYDGSTSFPYVNTSWVDSLVYNNSSNLIVTTSGSLNTGGTQTTGARPFAYSSENTLKFRTIVSDTPESITVRDDDTQIHISGTMHESNAANIAGTGSGVYSGVSGNTMMFKKLVPSGNTTITDNGTELIIYSSGDTSTVTIFCRHIRQGFC